MEADGTAYAHTLAAGEPSRLLGQHIRKVINWTLYVRSKMDSGDKLQVHPEWIHYLLLLLLLLFSYFQWIQ